MIFLMYVATMQNLTYSRQVAGGLGGLTLIITKTDIFSCESKSNLTQIGTLMLMAVGVLGSAAWVQCTP